MGFFKAFQWRNEKYRREGKGGQVLEDLEHIKFENPTGVWS